MTAKDGSFTPTRKLGQTSVSTGNRQPTEIRQNLSSGKSHTVAVEIKGRGGLKLNRAHLKGARGLSERGDSAKRSRDRRPASGHGLARRADLSEADKKRKEHLQALLKNRDQQDHVRQEESRRVEEQIRQTRTSREQKQRDQIEAAALAREQSANAAREKENAVVAKTTTSTTRRDDSGTEANRRPATAPKPRVDRKRRVGKLSIAEAMSGEDGQNFERRRRQSLAAINRRRDKERQSQQDILASTKKVQRQVIIPNIITVTELASRMAVRVGEVVKVLMQLGMPVKPTETIDAETAELVVVEFGHVARRSHKESLADNYINQKDDPDSLLPRSPVVTVMGHVDHGKTSLLDRIRRTAVVLEESGGITQHIGAYRVSTEDGKSLCFIDTPGHLAFSAMRARGADITDIVLLIIAADDGVQPQTREAIAHARAADKPFIVVLNKMDREEADADKIRQALLSESIVVESLKGDVQCVEVSAETGLGFDSLLEAISLQADLLELKADPTRRATGTVIESRLDPSRGTIATLLVQRGTLKQGEIVVAGMQWGRVRSMSSDRGEKLQAALPSTPVEIMGLNAPPSPGEDFFVVLNESEARTITSLRYENAREAEPRVRLPTQDIFGDANKGDVPINTINLFIKADVQGSLEAVIGVIKGLETEIFLVKIIGSGIGAIKESDVLLAQTSTATLIGFNVRANPKAQSLARSRGTDIFFSKIIYELIEYITERRKGLAPRKVKENILGRALVRAVFSVSKLGHVAGSLVTEGRISRNANARVVRDEKEVFASTVSSLRRVKVNVNDVASGTECGIGIDRFGDVKIGDIIECYEVVDDD